jgi:hypothetical protein
VVALLIVLIVTNLATLAAVGWLLLRPVPHPRPDEVLARSLARHRRPAVSTSSTRRVITIEILNAIELAGNRGRLAGIAGSLAPGITHRVVYDQAIKLVRRQLAEEQVVADVRLHVVATETVLPAGEPLPGAGEPGPLPPGPAPG